MNNADVFIIGSGPVGIAAACRLAGQGLRVSVLDGGAAITEPPASHFRNQPRFEQDPDSFFAAVDPYLDPVSTAANPDLPGAADSALFGGQGVIWTNNCPRAALHERWAALSAAVWDRYYAEAESLLGVIDAPSADSRTRHALLNQMQDRLSAEGRMLRDLPFAGQILADNAFYFHAPWDMLQALPMAVREYITLQQGIQVTRLNHQGGHVTGLDGEGPNGYQERINGSAVILAGGALATPQLLYQSGIRPATLGRGLSFHVLLFGQVVLNAECCPSADENDITPRLYIPPAENKPWHIQVLRDTCPLPPDEPVQNPHRLLEFQAFLAVEHNLENRLRFGTDGQVNMEFDFSETDRRLMQEMEADVQQLAGSIGRWRRGCEPVWVPHGTAHIMGTCRMDHDGATGVTDANGRVHGFENLYLTTAGLFPRTVAVNPTLTAVALALNTCDVIA